ncbi:MAG: 3-deoxy-D-manno-octulosonic acid transferase [Rhodobacteraceae bacterium]|nr:MAG: 3-deoxy-D-manno-octulosonic acid transferase [Paracoccaceae bacterium]
MPLYRVVLSLAWVPVAALLLLRVVRGRESLADWCQRMGLSIGGAPGPHLWLHAASNGELISARPVLLALRARHPGLKLLVTTNSLGGRAMARGWALDGLTARLAPVDSRRASVRLIRRYDVRGHVLLESEFWPNRIAALAARGLPVFAIGARLSRRSAQAWRRVAWLADEVMGRLTLVSPQDDGSRRRLLQLGLTAGQLAPVLDLKAFYAPPGHLVPDAALRAAFARDETWLAASTHEGEDRIVLAAHALLRVARPETRLIIAPRHPERGPAIASLARAAGIEPALRSAGEAPGEDAVYIADTLGEMPLWYALAGTTFIGGSLVDKGGHTPFEPAVFDSTLLHGPDTSNFTRIFRRLDVTGAAIQVSDAESLARALRQTLDPERRDTMRRMARDQLDHPADLDTVVAAISARLPLPAGRAAGIG